MPFWVELIIKFTIYFVILVSTITGVCLGGAFLAVFITEKIEERKMKK